MTVLYLDTETYSETPITHGTHRYAENAEVMIVTWAFDDGPVETLEFPARGDIEELVEAADIVVIHNSAFDRTVLRHALSVDIPLDKVFDTMACALSHSLPGSLGKLCSVMGVAADEAKDAEGKTLIQLFCKPRPKNQKLRRATRDTHPTEWANFLRYAGQDISAMRALYRKLPRWNYDIGTNEHGLWQLDQRINGRGIGVDIGLARHAIVACKEAKDELAERTVLLTDGQVQAATQRDQLLKYILECYGITLPDMQKGMLERRIEDPDLPDIVRELLVIRLSASSTSVSKYQRLVEAVSADGRLRGTLQFCGASRTGRWAGRLFQPQNLPRTPDDYTPERQETEIALFKAGMSDCLPDVIESASFAIRGAMVAGEGKRLVVADLANIEGRVLAWLAGEEWKIQAFKDYDRGEGPDLYKVTAARILNKLPADVTKHERQVVGKVPELACGYQGAAGAFGSMAKIYGLDLAPEEVLRIVRQWRDANSQIVRFWYDMEDAARGAVAAPGHVFEVGHIAVKREGAWLRIRLPSERVLCYPSPRVEWVKSPCMKCQGDGKVTTDDGDVKCSKCAGTGNVPRNQLTYAGVNQYTRKWERIKTYGGKLCIAQGTPVLTCAGWVPIERVTAQHRVWDGEQFVTHDGLAPQGVKGVISAHGVNMTPDHLVLTAKGWVVASQSERYNRAVCRLPDREEILAEQRAAVPVVGGLRVREHPGNGRERDSEASTQGHNCVVWVPSPGDAILEATHAFHVETSRVLGMALDDRPMPSADAPRMAQLRRARDYCMRRMGEIFFDVLERHGAFVPPGRGDDAGPQGQQRPLPEIKLSLGVEPSAGAEHAAEPSDRHATREDAGLRSGRDEQHRGYDSALPGESRVPGESAVRSSRRVEPVYDLVNCGPRKRFVVRSEDGRPLIVHNCENVVQATARDVIAAGMQNADRAGFEVLLSVHDEIITETGRDDLDLERLVACMTQGIGGNIPWTDGLPLAAEGFERGRYMK